jgi:hypothetical protein
MLEEAVSGMAGPLEDQLRTHFVGIVRKAQTEVFLSYHANNRERDSNSGTALGHGSNRSSAEIYQPPPAHVPATHINNSQSSCLAMSGGAAASGAFGLPDQTLSIISRTGISQYEQFQTPPDSGGYDIHIGDVMADQSTAIGPDNVQVTYYEENYSSMAFGNEHDSHWWQDGE